MENRTPEARPAPSTANVTLRLYRDLLFPGCIASSTRAAARIAPGKILLVALLCLGATPASAGSQPPLGWACWISEQAPVSIKCIRDRSHLRQATLDDQEAALRNLRPDTADAPEDIPEQLPHATSDGEGQPPQAAPDDPEDELEAEVLDQIYSKILVGDTARLDDLVEKHNGDLRKDSVWAIKIHTLPLDSSWLENRPARIVKSALCRGYSSCSVILREPGH